ncbi:MAG: filamentous hemagglutinin N-terminal domain-containing protein [Proteobacteria bacterium]|nr:filamentous hemagglutinin N-terminal domain-containing protein [Pseudomonadota bacterium]
MHTAQHSNGYQHIAGAVRQAINAWRQRLGMPHLAVLAGGLLVAPAALGLPTGQQVVAGSATTSTPVAGSLLINQTSQAAILNWQSFNIAAGEKVQFLQPNSASVALNRVLGNDASRIFGSLSSNGQVFLLNPNGVLFAPGSRIDTGGLVVSTQSISDADFMAGRYQFTGAANGEVRNQGSINALPGGYVLLSGRQVSNDGDISAPRGSVGLIAGERVTMDRAGDGMVRFSVDAAAVDARVANAGRITADGGRIALLASAVDGALATVVNQSGQLRANSISETNGIITLGGGESGTVSVTGSVTAAGDDAGEQGGQIRVLGDRVGLFAGTALDATGTAGGGQVLVGGNLQGKGPEQNASYAYVDTSARIDVSATAVGDGGKAIVWSDRGTQFAGSVDARGGAAGGNGGFVEVSGRDHLSFAGTSDRSAVAGRAGTLLLDPTNLTIDNSSDSNINAVTPFAPTAAPSVLTWNSIKSSLAGGNVVVTTAGTPESGEAGDITVAAASGDLTSGNSLTLRAAGSLGSINVNAAITNTGAGALSLEADGGISLDSAITLGGNLSLSTQGALTQSAALSVSGTTTLTGGAQSLLLTNAGNLFVGAVSASGSNISLRDSGALQLGTWITSGNVSLTAGGALTQTGTLSIAGNTTLTAVGNDVTLTDSGNHFTGAVSVSGRDVALRDSAALVLNTSNITGAATVRADGGLSQVGAVLVSGASSITATGQAVSLPNAGNNFGGALSLAAKDVIVTDTNALSLGASVITGNATVTAGGALTQTGMLSVTGNTAITATGQTVTLTHAGNDFSGTIAVSAKDLGLADANALALSASTLSGNANITAGGAVTQTGALVVNGTTTVAASGQSVALSNSANDFGGAVSVTAASLSLRDTSALILGTSTVGGNLSLIAGGALTQTGVLSVAGTTAITATGQNVSLTNVSNDFVGAVSSTANTLSLADANELVMGASTIANNLSVTTGGALTQSGALSVAGTTAINSVGQDVTLSNAANDFTGAVAIAARNAGLSDSNALSLGVSTVTGTASLTAGGSMSQTGAVTVGGTATLAANGGDLTLDNVANDFQGAVSVTGASVSLRDANDLNLSALNSGANKAVAVRAGGLLTLPAADINTGTADLTLVSGGSFATRGSLSASALSLTAGNGITLAHDITTVSTLTLATTDAAINQTAGALRVGGATSVITGTADASLTSANNDFNGTVSATVRSLSLRDATALTLGASTLAGSATLTTGGALTQSDVLSVAGTTTINATGQNVSLSNTSNSFTGAVATTAKDMTLTNAGALVLGTTGLSGNAVVQAAGAMTQTGAIVVAGTTGISAAGQNVTLANAANDFGGAVAVSGKDVSLADASALVLGASSVTGNATLSSGGAMTQTAALIVGGTTTITSTGQDVTLSNAGNDFGGAVATAARDASLRDINGLVLGTTALSANATLVAGGSVTQTGVLTISGTTAITATGQDVLLANAGNDFGSAVSVAGKDVSLRDVGSLALGASTVTGNATLVVGGALTQTGALTVAGTTGVTATGQDVLLGNGANDFGGAVSITGRDVTLRDATALLLGTNSVIGTATLTSGGALTQSGALVVTGNTTLNAVGQDVTLANAGNDFGGFVSVAGKSVGLRDVNALVLGASTISGDATIATAGAVTQTGAVTVAGATDITAINQDVTLSNAANDFGAAVSVAAKDVSLRDATALSLGTSTISGNAALVAGGAVTQTGALSVAGTTGVTALGQNVTLALAGNEFGGLVNLTARDVTLRDAGALSLGASTITGNAALTVGGALTQTGALVVTGTTGISATGYDVTLDTAGNDFGGAVSANANVLRLRDANALTLGATNVTSNATVVAGGAVTQSAAMTVAGNTTLTATGQDITLANVGNDFIGTVAVAGNNISLRDANGLALGASSAAGNLTLVAGGSVTQSAAITATGTTVITAAGHDVTLANAENDFGAAVSVSAKDLALRDSNALTLGLSAVTGNLALQSAGPLTQTAQLTVAGTSMLNSGAADLLLDNAGNDFQGSVSAVGGAVSLRDATALTVSSLASAPNKSVTLRAGGLLSLPATAINTGSADLTLTSGTTLLTTNALSGNAVFLSGSTGISLGNSVSAGSTLRLTSADAAISQSGGSITAVGATTISAGTGTVTLASAGNDFGGAVAVTARDLNLRDANALTLGASTLSGNTTLAAGGAITQTGVLVIAGTTAVSAAGQDVALNSAENDFVGAISIVGKDVSLRDANALALGASAIGGNLTLASGGALTQAGALTVAGTTVINGALGVAGKDVNLRDASGLTLSASSVAGSLGLLTGGAVTQSGALSVAGTTAVNAAGQNITLDNAANEFIGALTVNGKDVSLRDATALTLGASTISGAATLTSGSALTQTGALTVSGTTTVNAADQSVTLDNANNEFVGALAVTAKDASLRDGTAMVLGASVLSGNANITTGGALTQSGDLTVAGTTTITASGNSVTLANAGNDFTGAVSLSAKDAAVRDATALVLGASTLTGATTVTAGGPLTQSGALSVAGPATLTATGDITLDNAANDFQGAVGAAGAAIALRDVNALSVSSITNGTNKAVTLRAGGLLSLPVQSLNTGTADLTLGSGAALVTTGAMTGANIALTGASGITLAHDMSTTGTLGLTTTNAAVNQTAGSLRILGASTVAAGTGAVTLANVGNDFVGAVGVTGSSLSLRDVSTLVLGPSTLSGNANVIAGGPLTQSAAVTVGGTTILSALGQTITLNNSGNDFGGAVTATGSAVALVDKNALTATVSSTDASFVTGGPLVLSVFNQAGQDKAGLGRVDIDTAGNTLTWTQNGYSGRTLNNNNVGTVLTVSGAAGRAFKLSPLTAVVNFYPYSPYETRFRGMIDTTNMAMLYNGVPWGTVMAADSTQLGGGATQTWLAGLKAAANGSLAGGYSGTGSQSLLGLDGLNFPLATGQNSVEGVMGYPALATCAANSQTVAAAPCPTVQ